MTLGFVGYKLPTPPSDPTQATDPPAKLDHNERGQVRAAAARAPKIYPGPVGEVLSQYLLDWEQFGYRLGGGQKALVNRLVAQLMENE